MTSTMKIENGNKVWRNAKDQFHRTDGPAIEWADGYKEWWINGNLHRTDGPAIEWADGGRWFLNGEELTEDEFKRRTA